MSRYNTVVSRVRDRLPLCYAAGLTVDFPRNHCTLECDTLHQDQLLHKRLICVFQNYSAFANPLRYAGSNFRAAKLLRLDFIL